MMFLISLAYYPDKIQLGVNYFWGYEFIISMVLHEKGMYPGLSLVPRLEAGLSGTGTANTHPLRGAVGFWTSDEMLSSCQIFSSIKGSIK